MTKAKQDEKKAVDTAFTKQQLLASRKFVDRRDVLNVVLKDDKKYTLAQAEKLVDDFMKGKAMK